MPGRPSPWSTCCLRLAAAMAIALPVISASNAKTDAPITASALTVPAGFLAWSSFLYRLLDPVGDGSREIGLYLAAVASLGITVGRLADDGRRGDLIEPRRQSPPRLAWRMPRSSSSG